MISSIAFLGAIELGIVYGIVAFGVFLTFRMLDFPDLTVESSFPLGGAIAAVAIVSDINPWLATAFAFIGGGLIGAITAFLTVRLNILHLLSGILTMIAGFSINIRIMGRPNISLLGQETIFSLPLPFSQPVIQIIILFILVLITWIVFNRFLISACGLALRATGKNRKMIEAQGGNADFYVFLGVSLSNALVALGGALFVQVSGFADVTVGVGTIIFGLAAVVIGENILPSRKLLFILLSCLLGSTIYRLFVAFTLSSGIFGLQASDLNLVTSLLVILALIIPTLQKKIKHYLHLKSSSHD